MKQLFEELAQTTSVDGPLAAANRLVEFLRSSEQYPELFEALKIQRRLELGLSAVAIEGDPALSPAQAEATERGLLDGCREVGLNLLRKGQLQDGWLYMRPLGDLTAIRDAVKDLSVDSDNLDDFLQLFVHEGIDVGRGVRLSLEHRGTCNTISMMESIVSRLGRKDQQAGVGELVRHLHDELIASVRSDLGRREGGCPPGDTLVSIMAQRPDLLREGAYHLDTTHIASTVRLARVLDNREELALALDLCRYGRELGPGYQYPSEEPFGELYLMTGYFIEALLGEKVEQALHQFLRKAESLDPVEHGTIAIETYADLLARIGRYNEAIAFLIKRMPAGMRPFGIAPSLLELSCQAKNFVPMMDQSKARNDIIGYAAALLQSKSISARVER